MTKSAKIVVGFATAGFFLPLALLMFYAIGEYLGHYQNPMLLFYLCPASIVSMALDNAPWYEGVIVWLVIAAINAALYAALPFVIVLFYRSFRRDDRNPHQRWLS